MRASNSEKLHMYRVIPITFFILVTFGISAFFCILNHLYLDEMIVVAYLDVLFLALLVFELEFERKRGNISSNRNTTYSRIVCVYLFCCLIVLTSAFLPDFCRPFLLIPFLIFAVSNEVIALICSIYLLLLFAMTSSGDLYEVLCYSVLVVFGIIIAKAFEVKKYRILLSIITFSVSFGDLILFRYLELSEVDRSQMIYSGILSLFVTILVAIIYPVLRREAGKELHYRILDILSEDYSVVKELKNYFPADYHHAKQVADIAKRCALYANLNDELCEAGGFYYRIGKWQGEPHVKNGVVRANALCFPKELIDVIAEYYGEEALPSSPESALVHMVDAITIKLAALQSDVGHSTWNQEMIIYQALNEYSNQGLYDKSGLSMNHFLKIREFLAKENWLS